MSNILYELVTYLPILQNELWLNEASQQTSVYHEPVVASALLVPRSGRQENSAPQQWHLSASENISTNWNRTRMLEQNCFWQNAEIDGKQMAEIKSSYQATKTENNP